MKPRRARKVIWRFPKTRWQRGHAGIREDGATYVHLVHVGQWLRPNQRIVVSTVRQ